MTNQMQATVNESPLRGLSTIVYQAIDHAGAKAWYTELLGVAPYLDRGPYVEFRVGDYQHEIGIIDSKFLPLLNNEGTSGLDEIPIEQDEMARPGGAIAYWYVNDVDGTLARLLELGATLHHPPRDFGEGFIGATVLDPFGNILGVMHNPHYLAVLNNE